MTPRPALLFTLCYGAGLATGLLHFGGPLGVIVLLGAGMAARRSGALLLATGALLGRVLSTAIKMGIGCAIAAWIFFAALA